MYQSLTPESIATKIANRTLQVAVNRSQIGNARLIELLETSLALDMVGRPLDPNEFKDHMITAQVPINLLLTLSDVDDDKLVCMYCVVL